MGALPTIQDIKAAFQRGDLSSSALVEDCLERIQDPEGEGSKAFIKVHADDARQLATHASDVFTSSSPNPPLLGIPVSIKDLFNMEGHRTLAGSLALKDQDRAGHSATIVERLCQAGAIIIGRTNMTEFAYSGVGLNPHYGTPASPYDRDVRRIPGGSSSGSGVSVADRMAVASIGTDTGGSVRIPSALCGLVGFKPTAREIPTEGVFPLSSTFDSVGPLAPSVACCALLHQVMSGKPIKHLIPYPLHNLHIAYPIGLPIDQLDDQVSVAFERALQVLKTSGAILHEIQIDAFEHPDRALSGARMLAAEAYATHRQLLADKANLYDPRVALRILPAAETTASEYIDLLKWRKDFVQEVEKELYSYDALIMPTTPTIAPPISDLEKSDETYFRFNSLMLRNTSLVNQMDGCALSIPCHLPDEPPVGLMVTGLSMQDDKILQIGLSIEHALKHT